MKYMVMECHLSYAVVLDEEGHFLKVANRHYEVGQTVTDVIEMQVPKSAPQEKKVNKWVYSLAAMAACFLLIVTSVFQIDQMTYASVYMTINPEVRIDVNRKDVVVGLDAINADGNDLIKDYEYKKKDLNLVMDELVDRAIDMGYLHEGGQISLMLDAENDEWVITHSDILTTHLNEHLNEKLSVEIDVTDKKEQNDPIIIPIVPAESDYDESDYVETEQTTDPPINGQPAGSNYSDSNYGSSYNDRETDYDEQDEADDGHSDYDGQSDYEIKDGQSNYDEGQSEYDDWQPDYDEGQSDYDFDEIEDDGNSDYDDVGQSEYDLDTDYDEGESDYDDD